MSADKHEMWRVLECQFGKLTGQVCAGAPKWGHVFKGEPKPMAYCEAHKPDVSQMIDPAGSHVIEEIEGIFPWPTAGGIWMGYIDGGIGWMPMQAMELKDDLPSVEQMRLEKDNPLTAPPRATLAITAQFPQPDGCWPYLFPGNHPVKAWRLPVGDELSRAKKFLGVKE
ncbi:MAG TPA: hypothetical protein VGH19_06545 [Verrucomicrobiae bacterium]